MRPSEIGKVSVTKAVESEGIVEERDKGLGTTGLNESVLIYGKKLVLYETERERHMGLQHFFHDHPLALTHYRTSVTRYCRGCSKEIWGFSYSCQMCNFFLHKTCGEQPLKLQHSLHPPHLLTLRESSRRQVLCYFCNKYVSRYSGFVYHCSHCNFNLHLKCASIPFTIKAEFHDHSLKLMRKSVSFTCDACGKKDEDMYSYLCVSTTCSFLVHRKCAALPLRVKHISHQHALNLINSSQVNQSDRRICHVCVEKVDTDKIYYCSKCNFVAHLDCATREGDTEEINQPLELEVDESNIGSLAYVVNKIKIGEDNIEIAEEIKHLSHKHDLKLIDDELLNNEKCDGCMQRILFPPFYSCAQCRFFLHKSCVELPTKKRHPLHPHLLTLLTRAPYKYSISFVCNVCSRRGCDGFTYNCKECLFDAHVPCSLISDTFTHDGHEHQLFLSKAPYSEECSCCGNKGKVFKCADCKFILDLKCATLPCTVRYRCFEQLFKLCYKTEDDPDGEYYCDICETERDPKQWFYYCAELSFPAHPKCILGKFPYLKYSDMQ